MVRDSHEFRMKERSYEYTQRILGCVEGMRPPDVLAATAKKLDCLIAGISAKELCRRPAPKQWSVNEILAHLADAEIGTAFRVRFVLEAPGLPIVAHDQNQWVLSGHYDKRSPQNSSEVFRALRQGNLALLESLMPEQWTQYGIHSERGQESIHRIVCMFAGHVINHLQQIERILTDSTTALGVEHRGGVAQVNP